MMAAHGMAEELKQGVKLRAGHTVVLIFALRSLLPGVQALIIEKDLPFLRKAMERAGVWVFTTLASGANPKDVITGGLNDQFLLIDPPAGFDAAKGLADADASALSSSFPSVVPKAGQDTLRLFYVGKIAPDGTTPRDALIVPTIDGTVFAAPSSGRFPQAPNLIDTLGKSKFMRP